jgi:hypothetical protein
MFLETFETLKQVFGGEAMSRTQTHEWYKRFKEVQTSIEDNKHSGQPSTSRNEENIQEVWKVIRSDHCFTVRKVAEEDGI